MGNYTSVIWVKTGQVKATSPDLTLNGGLYGEQYQHRIISGIPIYPYIISGPCLANLQACRLGTEGFFFKG